MATYAAYFKSFLLLIFCVGICLSSDESQTTAPVILWTSDKSVGFPETLAGHTVSTNEFSENYLKKLMQKSDMNVVLVVQEQASITDFLKAGDVYGDKHNSTLQHIIGLMSELPSTYMPRVMNPVLSLASVIRPLFSANQTLALDDLSADAVRKLVLEPVKSSLITVHITHKQDKTGSAEEDCMTTLKHLDEVVGELDKKLRALRSPYAFIYTAKHSTDKSHQRKSFYNRATSNRAHARLRREPQEPEHDEDSETEGQENLPGHLHVPGRLLIHYGDQFLMYASNVTLIRNGTVDPLDVDRNAWRIRDDLTKCDRPEGNKTWGIGNGMKDPLLLDRTAWRIRDDLTKYEKPEGNKTWGIGIAEWDFETSSKHNPGYWFLKQFTLRYIPFDDKTDGTDKQRGSWMGAGGERDKKFVNQKMWAGFIETTPMEFSYHCHEALNVQPLRNLNVSEEEKKKAVQAHDDLEISFKGLQIQVFKFYVPLQFGHYNDCVGFFSIGVWSAIITMGLFTVVVLFGVMMLLNIHTMDRFDDPKGKPVTITVNE